MYNDFSKIKFPKEFAYFIGFVWADGCINRNSYIVIEINKDDALSLFNIFSKVGEFKYSERKREGRKEQSIFFFNNKELSKFFIDNGKYPSSIESHEKVLNIIPDEYKIYFLRGLIDGDGCFYGRKTNEKWHNIALQFTIGGRYDQDWEYLIKYLKELGINMTSVKRIHKSSKSSIIRSTSPIEIEGLIKKLYEIDDKIYLQRKYEKSHFIINEHKRLKEESDKRRQKYEIFDGYNHIIVNNLKKYAIDNGYSYASLNRLANNKIQKYKNFKIKKL